MYLNILILSGFSNSVQMCYYSHESESCSVMSDSLRPHGLYSPWNSPGQNTGVGSLSLLQGIFSTQGSNPGLPHCRWIPYQLSHKGSPIIRLSNHFYWASNTRYLYSLCLRSSELHFCFSRLLWLFGVFCVSQQTVKFFVPVL